MVFKKGDPKPPGSGRQIGTRNRLGAFTKEEAQKVFDALGGTAGFAEWAKNNKTEFYIGFMARAMPREHEVSGTVMHEHDFDGAIARFESALRAIADARRVNGESAQPRILEGRVISGDS